MVYTVKEFVDPFIANKNDKVDCLLSSLASSLHAEKIYMKPEDIILYSSGLRFNFFDANSHGNMHVMGLAGLSMDLIKDFVDKTNIGIDHFNFKEKKMILKRYSMQ